MIDISKPEVWNLFGAIYSARNAMNSWGRSDTIVPFNQLGENDLALALKLIKAGSEHRKFMRQIMVKMDILAPRYWWAEFDTYKVGTVANSCSTMHKLTSRDLIIEDFSTDHMSAKGKGQLLDTIDYMNDLREDYIEDNDKEKWYEIIQLLPASYNQLRTVTMNYEVVYNIIHQRKNHKLDEWHKFCDVLLNMPYMKEFTES